ncbi:MAG: hypothetical protein ABSG36_17095 [Acidimicrobiales bacterium]|jgi:hypothetical protein
MIGNDLIMQLTLEQGGGRETQVQPPIDVWVRYFDLDFDTLPIYRLHNRSEVSAESEDRPVVEHDHNWTIEIVGAELPRPAILRMHRTGPRSFDYWVYRPEVKEYHQCEWILQNFPNPYQRQGRMWIII